MIFARPKTLAISKISVLMKNDNEKGVFDPVVTNDNGPADPDGIPIAGRTDPLETPALGWLSEGTLDLYGSYSDPYVSRNGVFVVDRVGT